MYWFEKDQTELNHADDMIAALCQYCEKSVEVGDDISELVCLYCGNDDAYDFEMVEVDIVRCWNCDKPKAIHSANSGFSSTRQSNIKNLYHCLECECLIAVETNRGLFDPNYFLSDKLNLDEFEKLRDIDEELSVYSGDNGFEARNTIFLLSVAAKKCDDPDSDYPDQSGLEKFRNRDFFGEILFKENVPIGYLAYNNEVGNKTRENVEFYVLTQIFILPEFRRNGYGMSLFESWVENVALSVNDEFGVDRPKHAFKKMLMESSYVNQSEGDEVKFNDPVEEIFIQRR